MGVARKWVFPIIRLLIFAIIAVTLVKLAFFSGVTKGADELQPTGQIEQPQVTVSTGTIRNDVMLEGVVSADAAAPVKATLAGTVTKILVSQGQPVAAGIPVAVIHSETPGAVLADGSIGKTIVKNVTVTSPIAGTLSSLPVIVGQIVNVGDSVAQVAPPTFNVSGSLSPEQQYRLLNKPTDAQVAITGGPAAFTCSNLTITTPLAGAADSAATGGATGSTTTVSCAVPPTVTVFGGLAATITIAGGVAKDVLVVPMTAVVGSVQSGEVYLLDSSGKTTKTAVTLGLIDGKNVEITGGLAKGDRVLEFVPGAKAVDVSAP